MKEVVGPITEAVIEFIKKNYNHPRLWITLAIIVFCLVLLFPYIDSNFFYFPRIEKRISILEQVMDLDEDKINSNQAFKTEYESILQEMEQQNERSFNNIYNKIGLSIKNLFSEEKEEGKVWIKFLSGAIWCIIITLCVPFMNTFNKSSDKWFALIIMLIVTVIVGGVCAIIPIIFTPLINYIGIPILEIVGLCFFIFKSGKKDEKQKESKKED